MPPLAQRAWLRRVLLGLQLAFGAYAVTMGFIDARQSWFKYGGGAPKAPLYGIWVVEKMTINGVERAPLVTDWDRWRRVLFQVPTAMSFQRMDDTFGGFGATVDTAAKTIVLTGSGAAGAQAKGKLTYEQPSPDV